MEAVQVAEAAQDLAGEDPGDLEAVEEAAAPVGQAEQVPAGVCGRQVRLRVVVEE